MGPDRVNIPIHYLHTENTLTCFHGFAYEPVRDVKLSVPKEYVIGYPNLITTVLFYHHICIQHWVV